jgi:hypothetical protein
MPNPPPNLDNYAGHAYNAKKGNFLGSPVFVLTYDPGTPIDFPDSKNPRVIPDQFSASTTAHLHSVDHSLLMENKSDYDRSFSVSVDAEYSGVTYSGSASTSLLYHGNLFSSASSSYALNFYIQEVLRLNRLHLENLELDEQFSAKITKLPLDIESDADQTEYIEFFNSYGTHYAKFVSMGGMMVMETAIEDSVFKSSTTTEVTAAVRAGYNGVVASGEMNVNSAYSSSTFLEDHKHSIVITLDVKGGLWAVGDPITEWITSIYQTPTALLNVPNMGTPNLTNLASISELVQTAKANPLIADNINQMLSTYLMRDAYQDGLLSSPTTKVFSDVYQSAGGDGFLVGQMNASQNGDRGYLQAFDDTSDNPTTVRATASMHYYLDSDTLLLHSSLTMPTPHGTHYVAVNTPTAGAPEVSLNFLGFGNTAERGLGDWEDIDLDTFITAPSDGFVVAYVDWDNIDGSRGYIEGYQLLPYENSQPSIVAASSQHVYADNDTHVPTNSFCMPVRSGTNFSVNFHPTAGNPVANAFYVPLVVPLVLFDNFRGRKPNQTYQANSDGFLIAFLDANVHNGDRGSVDLCSYPDPSLVTDLGKLATASVHYYLGSDVYVPFNTAMIPVAKNNHYIANFTPTAGAPAIAVRWMPLGITSA